MITTTSSEGTCERAGYLNANISGSLIQRLANGKWQFPAKIAANLGLELPFVSDIINGKARLSSDVALRLEKAFGVSMDLLLRMQTNYEVAKAREGAGDVDVKRYAPAP